MEGFPGIMMDKMEIESNVGIDEQKIMDTITKVSTYNYLCFLVVFIFS